MAQAAQKITKLGGNFGDWYTQVLTKAECIDYFPVSGCYIIRPWAFDMWETIKNFFDGEIKKSGVKNCYFPTFIPKQYLETEKDHVEGFAAEVAWVTKSGSTDLHEPIAIRPTSETCMYPSFSKWIQSHRDMPLRLNQWCNVVRWEFSNPTPFIRSREFLWQEGHSAFATREEAVTEVYEILEYYRRVYEEILAVPVIKGQKTEYEKFAGGEFTTTVETFVPAVGRAVQSATSHHLGQNFSKMFDIKFENPDTATRAEKSHIHAFQNSWGLSTRSLGVLVMVHSDDNGLVLPPRVAPLQIVIVPCGLTAKATQEEIEALYAKVKEIERSLDAHGIRVKADLRDTVTPGWKYADWEMRGVPIRLEVGPKDIQKGTVVAARRDKGKEGKVNLPLDNLATEAAQLLETMQKDMFNKAKEERDAKLVEITKWADFTPALNNKCLCLCPCCDDKEVEVEVKKRSKAESQEVEAGAPSMGAKSICIPLEQKPLPEGATCIITGKPATKWIIFGRSF